MERNSTKDNKILLDNNLKRKKNMYNKKNQLTEREGVMITDMISDLCLQLATLFSSLSSITRTCIGLKEQLGNMSAGEVNGELEQVRENKHEETKMERK